MDRHDGSRVRRNGGFNLFWVDIAGCFVDIDKNGLEAIPPDGMRRCDKAVWCRNDFTRDSHGLECRDERERSVCEQADILYTKVVC